MIKKHYGTQKMKSKFVEKYNHDDQANSYDSEVQDENNPVRAGYKKMLDWIIEKAGVANDSAVADFGCGTGNLSMRLESFKALYCIDISEKMMGFAREKLGKHKAVHFIKSDFLEYFYQYKNPLDVIISSYALHHLTEDEKFQFLDLAVERLKPNGKIIIGDGMFLNENEKQSICKKYIDAGQTALVHGINDEFFWMVEQTVNYFKKLKFSVEYEQLSELSWGIAAYL